MTVNLHISWSFFLRASNLVFDSVNCNSIDFWSGRLLLFGFLWIFVEQVMILINFDLIFAIIAFFYVYLI